MDSTILRVGLVGLGHLGKIHLKCIKLSPYFLLKAVWDTNQELMSHVNAQEGLSTCDSFIHFLDQVDAVVIVSPTTTHYELAAACLVRHKHIFIEKPVTATLEESIKLKELTDPKKIKIQVGHVERFNPAFLAVKDQIKNPMFIEGHRLAEFKPRGTDVSVVMDLMIHDIDLVLSLVKSPIKEIRASGVNVMSPTPDICNTRLEFVNGAVANLTASRVSIKQMRKLRIFQQDQYISMDLLSKESQIVKISDSAPLDHPFSWTVDTGHAIKHIQVDMPIPENNNAILEELNAFALSILKNTDTAVTLSDGIDALDIAEKIQSQMASA